MTSASLPLEPSLPELPWTTWTPAITLDFADPGLPDTGRLDAWLTGVLDISAADLRAVPGATPGHAHVWRILLLARVCLLQCRVPAFEPPRLLGLQPGGGNRIQAKVTLPWIDQIHLSLYAEVVQQAARLVAWCGAHPIDDAHCASFFEQLRDRILLPCDRRVPGGRSTIPVLRTAHDLNIPFRHLGAGVYQLGLGHRARRLDRSSTDRDAAFAVRLTQHKGYGARLLRAAGLPAAEHFPADTLEHARAAAARLGWPVAVKPVALDRGEGVSVGVGDDAGLAQAFAHARQCAPRGDILVERQAPGTCHRLFMARGELLYAVKRRAMGVIGDGRRSVARLVDEILSTERRLPPWRRSGLQTLDALAEQTLAAAGLAAGDVPAAGAYVALRPIETTAWGGLDEDVSDRVHPENRRLAALAGKLLGLEIAGVDIMSPDIGQPWQANGAIINEVNYAPLLGGGEVSRARLPDLLRQLLPDGGRIPLFEARTADAWNEARTRWSAWREEGRAAYLTRADRTWGPDGELVPMTIQGTRQRVAALLTWPTVEALAWVAP
ncbi:MAG: hypothetical protein M0R28_11475 [Pigmentiphaga sp.]|nr:hypothetical protein [Pigmentiphaga sp.]